MSRPNAPQFRHGARALPARPSRVAPGVILAAVSAPALAVMLAFAALGCGSPDAGPAQVTTADPNLPGTAPAAPGAPLGSNGSPAATAGSGSTLVGTGGVGGAAGSGANAMTTQSTDAQGSTPMPCDVATVVATNCQTCHGATPIGGAPMSLLSYDDFHKPAKTKPSLQVYELAKMRINAQSMPMPPGGAISHDDFSVLDDWLGQGAPAGTDADRACAGAKPPADMNTGDGTYGKLTALPGETCYEFPNHASTDKVDDTKYEVPTGEHYAQFYYDIPWAAGSVATRYGTDFDNEAVLHHWLLFTSDTTDNDGYHEVVPLPTLVGDSATLLAGWAVGGTNLAMPEHVGLELPDPGTVKLNGQWHFFNSTGSVQYDHSAIQVCTMPASAVQHVATITWIGTEDLGGNKWFGGAGMPPGQVSTFEGTCDPLREGMNSTDPIHIIGFWPHMHLMGTEMKAIVNHQDGTSETIFDKPFDFNKQIHYMQDYDLAAGDTLTAQCIFNNTTDHGVAFGESTHDEMCYNFTMAWPAHALENHVASLIGATNTCW